MKLIESLPLIIKNESMPVELKIAGSGSLENKIENLSNKISNLIFLYDIHFNVEQQETDFLSKLVSDKACALLSLSKDEDVFDLFNKAN